MRAVCPDCNGTCKKLSDGTRCFCTNGYVEVNFPSGKEFKLWSRICNTCGGYAGGCFSGLGLPTPSIGKYSVCPQCGGHDIRLEEETNESTEEFHKSVKQLETTENLIDRLESDDVVE